ncbi:GspH/FimT family pseudopilin [Rudaea sp.]|uniref:GspH/FimT family pseudopilin n=1 Tax=Rudaea sp. TaxID=2136325 RepID=UPI002ED2B076
MKRNRGLSLIEMMIALAILVLLILMALPSYSQWLTNTRIRNAAESIHNGLQFARNEAVQRNTNVRFELGASGASWTVCVLPSGKTSCADAGVTDKPQSFNASGGAGDVVIGTQTDTQYANGKFDTALTSGAGGITFNALGRPVGYSVASFVRVDASSAQSGTRRLVTTIAIGGRIRMCDPALTHDTSPQGCS